ncbi:alpha-amylase [Bifidobacterium callitrichos]|nr:alpha-amylase [Bifidobacterium callitrichos]
MSDITNHPDGGHPAWLADACFYEIYPQSFNDSNGDGIGDIPGITAKLDYIRDLGCNALWINPCYDSPFKDAGYDVRDYRKVAPRYGTNDDLIALFDAAHERGMHVLLDLVPGHTSEEHAWFRASARPDPADRVIAGDDDGTGGTPGNPAGDMPVENVSERYIWTDCWISGGDGLPFIGGETERDGTYILNFFKCQPALNYGFAHPKPGWQKPALGPDALATCDTMVDVMRFWLTRGADGFRVDMADSLVKHDDWGKPLTIRTWRYMFSKIRPEFPEAAFVAEWGRPNESMQAGFDMDFYLDWRWDGNPNGYNMLLRNTDTPLVREGDHSYFNADSGESIRGFLEQYEPQLRDCERAGGRFDLITSNHDTLRVGQRLTERELKIAYGMLLTMPGCPFVYYGDEIAMRYRPLPTKEGGYVRTGSRTPMQWDAGMANLGFSEAGDPASLYLPVESGPSAPGAAPVTVADRMADTDSLWRWMQAVLRFRHATPALASDAGFEVLSGDGRLFAYRRTAKDAPDCVIVAMNPGRDTLRLHLDDTDRARTISLAVGEPTIKADELILPPQSLAILR